MRESSRTWCAVVLAGLLVACARSEPSGPRAEAPAAGAAGTVPIIRTIGWWDHQDALHVAGVDVELVGSQPGSVKADARIRFHIRGSLVSTRRGWRPLIDAVHISQRFVQE